MKILYLGYYADKDTYNIILNNKINNMSQARQSFEEKILSGLVDLEEVDIEIASYIPSNNMVKLPDSTYFCGRKINYFKIKKKSLFSLVTSCIKYFRYLMARDIHGSKIIMYAVNPLFMIPLLFLKKKYNLEIITICSEVPKYRRWKKTFLALLKKKIQIYFNSKFDKYILLSKHMVSEIDLKKRPYMVLEGIGAEVIFQEESLSDRKKNIVMYAGGLAKDNNINLLIEACSHLKTLDELWICGVGECEEEVIKSSENNPKIKYFGRVDHQRVLEMQRKAKVLVNLRNPNEILTKYSFPSKIIEYMSSGTITLSTRLEGIPDDYFNYIVSLDSLDVNELKDKLYNIFNLGNDEYLKISRNSQLFIQKEKTAGKQCKRIIDFIK